MGFLFLTLKRIAGARVWRNEQRKVQTLLSFARTEAGGAVDIARAAHAIENPDLKKHLLRHVADEDRHAEMFRRRAREVFGNPDGQTPRPDSVSPDLVPAASHGERGTLSLTDHGVLPSHTFKDLGEVRYIAMLHLAEVQAAEDFKLHKRLTEKRDPQTGEMFRSILRDEEYHIAYTRSQLKTWESEGRGKEVRQALRNMRWFRCKTAVVQGSQRVGELMGTLMLTVVYCTLFLPFGILGALSRRRTGWLRSQRAGGRTVLELRQQA